MSTRIWKSGNKSLKKINLNLAQFAAPAGSDVESIRAEAAKLVEMAEAEETAEKEAVANAATVAETLLKLKQLYDAGVLTEEEYAGKREKLIEKL